jgi:hypothetical protein
MAKQTDKLYWVCSEMVRICYESIQALSLIVVVAYITNIIMHFNPDQWPSHNRGEATRQSILAALTTPHTRAELTAICGKSRKQIDRHLSRLSSECKIFVNDSGLIALRLSVGLLSALLTIFEGLTQG